MDHFPALVAFARTHIDDPDLYAVVAEIDAVLSDRLAAAIRRRDDALEIDRLTSHSHLANQVGYRLHALRYPNQAGRAEFQADILDDLEWAEGVITTLRATGICK